MAFADRHRAIFAFIEIVQLGRNKGMTGGILFFEPFFSFVQDGANKWAICEPQRVDDIFGEMCPRDDEAMQQINDGRRIFFCSKMSPFLEAHFEYISTVDAKGARNQIGQNLN